MPRRTSYLNVILTVNAVLLAGLLWTQVADQPLLASTAQAEPQSRTMRTPTDRFPNAASQRLQIIQTLRETKRSIDGLRRTVEAGELRVAVTNLNEIDTSK